MKWKTTDYGGRTEEHDIPMVKIILWSLLAMALIVTLSVGGCAGCKSFNRYQRRADANNKVKVTQIEIRNARQQVSVQRQLAQVKLAEAVGIRKAQDEISRTLTDKYLQHEAIQAQLKMAGSPNHTQVYIPSGNNGIPIVKTTK